MTQNQIKRYHVILNSLEGMMTISEAADTLDLSKRQVIRLRNAVKAEGFTSLIHKNLNKTPSNALDYESRAKLSQLYASSLYKGTNFRHFTELLEKHEGIKHSYRTVHRVLTEAGHSSPKSRRRNKTHPRRKRMALEGQMIQIDASTFDWFEDGRHCTIHGGIDDATGKLVGLFMSGEECLGGYFALMHQIIEKNGIPYMVYADRRANDAQFGRAMQELGIRVTPATSPQAKGRIERVWGTLQSRLTIELRIANITDIEGANDFLLQYMCEFNKRFAVIEDVVKNAYVPLAGNINLSLILCEKVLRKVDNGGVLSYDGKLWQLSDSSIVNVTVEIVKTTAYGVLALYQGNLYATVQFNQRQNTNLI